MFRLFPGRSGQAAMEYLMIAAFIGILIVPATFIYYHYATESSDQIDKVQLDRIGRNIVSTAERFYYHGYPSTIVIQETMPANVLNMSIEHSSGNDNILNTPDDSYLLVVTARNLQGGNSTFGFSTKVKINGTFGDRAISAGKKNIRFSVAPGDKPFVAISMEDGECKYRDLNSVERTLEHVGCCETVPTNTRKSCFNGVLIDDDTQRYCPNPPSTPINCPS